MKLKLKIDELQVEAFVTTSLVARTRGTVRAQESILWTVRNCPPQTADDTCGMTCGPTCEPASCNPDTVCGCV